MSNVGYSRDSIRDKKIKFILIRILKFTFNDIYIIEC